MGSSPYDCIDADTTRCVHLWPTFCLVERATKMRRSAGEARTGQTEPQKSTSESIPRWEYQKNQRDARLCFARTCSQQVQEGSQMLVWETCAIARAQPDAHRNTHKTNHKSGGVVVTRMQSTPRKHARVSAVAATKRARPAAPQATFTPQQHKGRR